MTAIHLAPLPFDPLEWAEDFAHWAIAYCLLRDECLWSVEALHDAFCEWCDQQASVPCMAEIFGALLELEGFRIATGMVSGLVLKTEYLGLFQPAQNERRSRHGMESATEPQS